jgi:sugar lactone lactonase YvrE
MKPILFTLIMTVCFNGISQSLHRLWETDTLLLKPESAIYDSTNKIIYVSNINGEYLAKDGNGYISKINTNGKIETLKWVTGLDNPQGMGIYKNKLYVADINRLVEINISTARIEKEYKVDTAKFFNDVTVDNNGDVYVSDCFGGKIYQLRNNKISIWASGSPLYQPNGLLCVSNNIFILNMGDKTIYKVNKKTKVFSTFCTNILNPDGIVTDGNDGYFVSGAWQGELFHINAKGEKTLLLSLLIDKTIIADIEYIPSLNLLLIPTLNKTLIAYKWN